MSAEPSSFTRRLGHVVQLSAPEKSTNPIAVVKLKLMSQIKRELQSRYGTQQVAADAMEMHQPDISDLYNGRDNRFSLAALVMLADKLGKKVEVQVV